MYKHSVELKAPSTLSLVVRGVGVVVGGRAGVRAGVMIEGSSFWS